MKQLFIVALIFACAGCGSWIGTPRMVVLDASTIGLCATPGDGSRPPQVTFAYKRSELALVPVERKPASTNSDCFSALTALDFRSKFFGTTSIDDFIATGHAARSLATNVNFGIAVSRAVTNSTKE